MAQLESLLDRVHDEFPAVPKAIALRALSDSAREFCTRTYVWTEDLDPIQLKPNELAYDLFLGAGVRVVSLVEVRKDGRRLDPLVAEYRNLADTPARRSLPDGYFQSGPETIELVHEPQNAQILTVRAALTLAMSGQPSVPDTLTQDHGEAIASGAKMRLVRQAGQAWAAPDAAPIYATPYYTAVNETKAAMRTALGVAQAQIQFGIW